MRSTTPKQMTLGSLPEERHAQALDALEYANEVRRKRAKILNDLTAGTITLEEVLDNEWCQKATVFNVIRKQHRWGRQRTVRLLAKAGIPEVKEVGTLTIRQRAALLTEINRLRSARPGEPRR